MVILICVLLIAVIVDIISYRIPNMCIVVGLLCGFMRAFSLGGLEMVLRAAGLMLIVFVIGYPFYVLKGIGAGDIKLMMVIASYLPKDELRVCVIATILIAGVVAGVKMFIYKESRERLWYLLRYLRKLIWCQTADTYVVNKMDKRCMLRLSVPMFCSVLLLVGGIL